MGRDTIGGAYPRILARVQGARGRVTVLVLGRAVVQAQCTGALDAALVEELITALERYRPTAAKVTYFLDLGELENYDASFRPAWLDWAKRNAESVGVLHVFAKASIVKMGVQMLQLAIGNDLVVVQPDMKKMNELMDAAVLAAR